MYEPSQAHLLQKEMRGEFRSDTNAHAIRPPRAQSKIVLGPFFSENAVQSILILIGAADTVSESVDQSVMSITSSSFKYTPLYVDASSQPASQPPATAAVAVPVFERACVRMCVSERVCVCEEEKTSEHYVKLLSEMTRWN